MNSLKNFFVHYLYLTYHSEITFKSRQKEQLSLKPVTTHKTGDGAAELAPGKGVEARSHFALLSKGRSIFPHLLFAVNPTHLSRL